MSHLTSGRRRGRGLNVADRAFGTARSLVGSLEDRRLLSAAIPGLFAVASPGRPPESPWHSPPTRKRDHFQPRLIRRVRYDGVVVRRCRRRQRYPVQPAQRWQQVPTPARAGLVQQQASEPQAVARHLAGLTGTTGHRHHATRTGTTGTGTGTRDRHYRHRHHHRYGHDRHRDGHHRNGHRTTGTGTGTGTGDGPAPAYHRDGHDRHRHHHRHGHDRHHGHRHDRHRDDRDGHHWNRNPGTGTGRLVREPPAPAREPPAPPAPPAPGRPAPRERGAGPLPRAASSTPHSH